MNKKKNINIFKIIWVSGIFIILIIILIMVMNYKINYQHLRKNYLYFYNCNDSVCTAQVKDGITKETLYSTYECEYEICPAIKKVVGDSYVILNKENKNILYDFMNNKIISDNYEDYNFINEKYIIVTQNNYQGLIDTDNNILIKPIYQQLGYTQDDLLLGYNLQKIIVKKDNLYGIVSMKTGEITEKIEYKEENIEELLTIINS